MAKNKMSTMKLFLIVVAGVVGAVLLLAIL